MHMRMMGVSLALLCMTSVASAQENTSVGGHFDFRLRSLVGNHNDGAPYDNVFSTLRLKLHSDVSDHISAHVSGDMRLYARSTASTAEDLSDMNKQYDVSATVWEAYFDMVDLVEGLEMRFGKQRIAWGKADKFNPTDNLNPDDLGDILEFGNHVPSLAVSASYTFNDMFALDVIWLPSPRAVLMPRTPELRMQGELTRALAPTMAYLGGFGINPSGIVPATTLTMPAFDLKHSMQAVKLKGTLGKIDYSLSYFHGYDDVPVPGALSFELDLTDPLASQSSIDMQLMEMHVIGLDLAGELAGMGWWAEGALFIPNEVVFQSRLPNLLGGEEILDATVIEDKPYFKATVGIDYTFKFNLYVNVQYVHGLFLERGDEGHIYDYLFVRLEQKLLHEKLKLSLTAGGGIMDFSDVSNNWALMVSPKVEWSPFDSMHIGLGAVWLEGKSESGDSLIATLDGYDMVFVNFKVDF